MFLITPLKWQNPILSKNPPTRPVWKNIEPGQGHRHQTGWKWERSKPGGVVQLVWQRLLLQTESVFEEARPAVAEKYWYRSDGRGENQDCRSGPGRARVSPPHPRHLLLRLLQGTFPVVVSEQSILQCGGGLGRAVAEEERGEDVTEIVHITDIVCLVWCLWSDQITNNNWSPGSHWSHSKT